MSPEAKIGRLATRVHGRYLLRRAEGSARGTLLGFHGYGETAEAHMQELERIPGLDDWDLVAVNALHQFYRRSGEVVSSWMTSRDRELMIEDNRDYVRSVVDEVVTARPLVVIGFSQGVAMAYRTAALAELAADGVVALAGDLPPELAEGDLSGFPPVLIARGDREEWYTPEKLERDVVLLEQHGITPVLLEYDGGHQWTDAFRRAASRFLRSAAAAGEGDQSWGRLDSGGESAG